jgi:excisionase family DNA binding protein
MLDISREVGATRQFLPTRLNRRRIPVRQSREVKANSQPIPKLAYKPAEAAAMLSISERSLWSLMNMGKIRATKIGRSVRYSHSELERFLQSAIDENDEN